MHYLEKIVERKRREYPFQRRRASLYERLMRGPFAVVAEIKRRSPSKGALAAIESPEELAAKYVEGGAAALSVLTDSAFSGALRDLRAVAAATEELPLLRKDFVVSPEQIFEAASAGGSVVLLIVKILGRECGRYIELAASLGLEALVEVHDEEELEIALEAGAKIVGVNNRNLETFSLSLEPSFRLAPLVPREVALISESGISSKEEIVRLKAHGFRGALIGEALVTANDPKGAIEELLS